MTTNKINAKAEIAQEIETCSQALTKAETLEELTYMLEDFTAQRDAATDDETCAKLTVDIEDIKFEIKTLDADYLDDLERYYAEKAVG